MADHADEPTVYKQLSTDMRQGLKDIYQQISTASSDQASPVPETDALFHEASDAELLAAVREGTATESQKVRLAEINSQLGDDLTSLLTTLSFQDITGQRIKRVVAALNKIENSVVELYVSSGLIMDGAEKDPAKNAQALKEEASKAVEDFRQNRKVVSSLNGPQEGVSQGAIDDMLAQLGM